MILTWCCTLNFSLGHALDQVQKPNIPGSDRSPEVFRGFPPRLRLLATIMWMRNSARSSFLQELPQFSLQRCMGRKTPWSRFQHFRNSHRDHSTSHSFLNFPITAQRFRLPPQTWWCCASKQQAVTGWILFITCVAPRRYKQYFLLIGQDLQFDFP